MKHNFDTIAFICTARVNEHVREGDYLTENHRFLDVSVLLNGTKVDWDYVDVYTLALQNLDHKPKYSHWSGAKLDGKVIPDAKWSVFEPFTCSCGVGGCVGIWDGIYIKERGYSVEWRAKVKDGYGFLPKTFFNFEKSQYKHAFSDMLAQIVGLSSDYPNTILVVDAGYCEEQLVTGIDFLDYVRENTK